MLELKNISKHFEGQVAVDNVTLTLNKKEILCITGGNGSGKTTLFNIITGFEKVDSGSILFNNINITNLNPSFIARQGIARLFQSPRIFNHLTVLDNILVSASNHPGERIENYILAKHTKIKDVENENTEKAIELLNFFQLIDKKNDFASHLSFGQKKLLCLAMLLMNNAELILLDEIYSGMNQSMIFKINTLLTELTNLGKSFVIIEHRINEVESICHTILQMEQGKLIS